MVKLKGKTKIMRLALAQLNPTVGDLKGNSAKVLKYVEKAKSQGADVIICPELVITGYPPEDLLLKSKFVDDNIESLNSIAKKIKGITAIVGFVSKVGKDICNSAAVISDGAVVSVYHKMFLPNYGVFDEVRYFKKGKTPLILDIGDFRVGVGICEDLWEGEAVVKKQSASGAGLILNLNASPYHLGKHGDREEMLLSRARKNNVVVAYANLIGGQDELVFDGKSLVVGSDGDIVANGKAFKEDLIVVDVEVPIKPKKKISGINVVAGLKLSKKKPPLSKKTNKSISENETIEEVYNALLLGTRDYVKKNGFKKCLVAVSGGVDSALVVALAVAAVGEKNVRGIMLPSPYTSKDSKEDCRELLENLGVREDSLSIGELFSDYKKLLKPIFKGTKEGVAEENLQARIRGNIVMAMSNKFGSLVLTTGNKSEMSVGYSTLYGDMAGGFAVMKDVPKLLVYELCHYINRKKEIIPNRIITKAPSAELRPNQKDEDSLPPYELLDEILKFYIEDDLSVEEIVSRGYKKAVVCKVAGLVDLSEYKRRQSAPGIKITHKAFGRDRRMPIVNRYGRK